ncbi:MAG: lysozyme, partial [Myxococcota bacterium]
VQLLTAACLATTPASSAPTSAAPLEGIDVSHYQGDVDWASVRSASIDFAYAKATQGASEVDPHFAANGAGMKSAGLPRGAYHFYVAGDPPLDQAKHFTSTVTLAAGDLVPMVDVEVGAVSAKDLQTFVDALLAHYGVPPIVYTDHPYWTAHLDDSFSAYPLWIADYEGGPRLPSRWSQWSLWQYEEDGKVSGVKGAVDRDRMRGPLSQFQVH